MKLGMSWAVAAVAASAACMLLASANQAQTPPRAEPGGGTKVGVVDVERVFEECEQTQVLNRKIEAYRKKVAQEVDQREEAMKAEQAALEAFAKDSADYYKRNKEFKQKVLEYNVWKAMTTENMAESYRMWVERTYQMITAEVEAAAKGQGVQLVLVRDRLKTDVKDTQELRARIISRKVVYAEAGIDLTEKVLADLNTNFQKAGGPDAVEFIRP